MVKLKVVEKEKPPEPETAKERFREDFLGANHALLQAHSLIDISQESYTDPESENIYNLLGVLDEKINIARKFFDEHDLCWAKEATG